MKGILALAVLAVLAQPGRAGGLPSPPVSSSQAEASIRLIRHRYARINRNASRYRKVKKALSGFSAEGGEMVAYFAGAAVMKIVATYYGEMGRSSEEYYYWDEKLIFVFRKEYGYDRPLSGKVTRAKENRLYFSDGKLIRWVNEDAAQVTPGTDEYREKQDEYLQNSGQFIEAARSPDLTIEAAKKEGMFHPLPLGKAGRINKPDPPLLHGCSVSPSVGAGFFRR